MNRPIFIFLSLIVLTFTVIQTHAAKVMFLYGDRSHKSGDHEFKAGSHLLAKHLNAQKKVNLTASVHNGWPENESILDDFDAIVIYADGTKVIGNGWNKMNQLVREKRIGLLFIHYAVHPDVEEGEKYYLPWIGGFFKNGISVNPFWRANIKPLKGHETGRGVGPIKAVDEFYFNIQLDPDSLNLGAATPNEKNLHHINNIWTRAAYLAKGKKQSLLWGITRPGGGRGAGFTGGHHHRNWAIDGYRQLVLNVIAWIAGENVPENGVPTYAVTEDELNEELDDYGEQTNRIKLPTKEDITFNPGPWMTPEEHAESRKKPKTKKK
tara:strand:- start:27 stop:995 length:969 start_codon:yes stop_codon:yes gene_type:complete